jgi:hypothetical protein
MTEIIAALVAGIFAYIFGRRQTEHQIHYAKLHEHRAEVVGQLYKLLYDAHIAFGRWVTPSGYDKERQMNVVAQRYNDLVDYYYPHALWLDKGTQEKLERLIETMKGVFEDFSVLPESGNPSHLRAWNAPRKEDMPKLKHEVTVRVLKEIPALREQLHDEFQAILYPRASGCVRCFGRIRHGNDHNLELNFDIRRELNYLPRYPLVLRQSVWRFGT